MAQDEEKTTVETKKNDDAEESEKPVKKGLPKPVLFGGIGVLVVVLGVVLALFVLKPMMSGNEAEEIDDHAEQTENVEGDKAKHQSKQKSKQKQKKDEHGKSASLVYAIKDIVVNPAGTGGTRFLSVSFGFELESPDLVTEFEERELIVRDALITILSSKTVAELTNARQKEIIRYQIKKRLSNLLKTEEIAGVYYTDFVLQ